MSENMNSGGAPVETAPVSEATSQENTESLETQELSEEGGEEVAKPASKIETKELAKTLRKLKLKVDKAEYDEELPFDLPDDPKAVEYMKKQLQMAKMGGKRAQQYSELENEVREFVDLLRKNPKKALSDPSIGLDLKKFAAEIIEEEIANSQKTPEQIEKEKLAQELEELRAERKREKEEHEKNALKQRETQEYARYEQDINKALAKNGLPQNTYTVKKMASYLYDAVKEGIDVSAEDVAPLVKQEMHNDLKEMFATSPDDVIEQLVGKDVLNRIRKKNLANRKEKPPVPVNKSVVDVGASKSGSGSETPAPKKTFKEFFGV